MDATRDTTRSGDRESGGGFLVSGAWAGLFLGLALAALQIARQDYVGQGLWFQAVRLAARSLWLGTIVGIAFHAASALLLRLVRRWSAGRLAYVVLALALVLVLACAKIGRLDARAGLTGIAFWFIAAVLLPSLLLQWSWPGRAPIALALLPLLVPAGASLAAWRMESARSAAVQGRPNVLFVLIDALRADHVGCYGYDRPTTPTLDALAAQGVRFARDVSPSNRTRSSMPSIWTGLYPSRTGMFKRRDVLNPRFLTVAELYQDAGYRTLGLCPNPSLNRVFGHNQGWGTYEDDVLDYGGTKDKTEWARYETASKLNKTLLEWLAKDRDRPFLAWLHYRDVHSPYLPPPGYDTMFPPRRMRPISKEERGRLSKNLRSPDDGGNLEYYLSQYDGEIRYTDDQFAELLKGLEALGLRKNTILIVTADHGESFLEHGAWEHGDTLHEELLHVPLIIVRDGMEPRVVDRIVSGLDLFPTMLAMGGLPERSSDGYSLVPLMEGRDQDYPRQQAYAETDPKMRGRLQRAIREQNWKLIVDNKTGSGELFDLASDPGETSNLMSDQPKVARQLWTQLASFVEKVGGTIPKPAEQTEIDQELEDKLGSLGYVE